MKYMMPRFKGKRVVESSVISFLLLLLFTFIIYKMFEGFYLNILLVLVLAVALRPLHKDISASLWGSKRWGAAVTIVLTLLLVLLPLFILLQFLAAEAVEVGKNADFYTIEKYMDDAINNVNAAIEERTGRPDTLKKEDVTGFIQAKATSFGQTLLGVLSNLFSMIASVVILLMTIYYTLVDWDNLKKYIYRYSPLTDKATRMMSARTLAVIRAAIRGHLVMILVYAIGGWVGFLMFGVPSPVLLGAIYGVASLVPVIGTGVIWIPSVIYLLISGNIFAALGFALWNMAIIGSLDNFIMPAVVRKGASLHPFLILIGVFGGISLFGIVGFFIGPVIIALTLVSVELFKENSRSSKTA